MSMPEYTSSQNRKSGSDHGGDVTRIADIAGRVENMEGTAGSDHATKQRSCECRPGALKMTLLRKAILPLALALLLLSLTYRLEGIPPVGFDEGWVMSVARNWAELDRYVLLVNGSPTSPSMLNIGFPAVAPITLSFRLFGAGIWQGRLPGVLFTIGAMCLLYHLALRLYDRKIALGTLFVAVFMSGTLELHPIIMGRQALGEVPAVFLLLAGYESLLSWRRCPLLFLPLAALFWGLAAATKMQVLPFLVAGLAIPIVVGIVRQRWRTVVPMLAGLCGFLACFWLFRWVQEGLLQTEMFPQKTDLYSTTAIVPVLSVRVQAAVVFLVCGLPALIGAWYGAWQFGTGRTKPTNDNDADTVRQSLFFLVTSWMAWYLLFSIGWVRYLFVPVVVSSMFVSAMLCDMFPAFSISATVRSAADTILRLRFGRNNLFALAFVLLFALLLATVINLFSIYTTADRSSGEVAEFLNTATPPNALIETYDMELFVLLNRRYHYPPDEIQLKLNRRRFMGQKVGIDYDPMAADPDYLVIGPMSRMWHLYDPVLETGSFRLVLERSRYQVYERIRPTSSFLHRHPDGSFSPDPCRIVVSDLRSIGT
jgi:4-amino-4-deoxy-L-arabinose transferase-like glycosyltransferase